MLASLGRKSRVETLFREWCPARSAAELLLALEIVTPPGKTLLVLNLSTGGEINRVRPFRSIVQLGGNELIALVEKPARDLRTWLSLTFTRPDTICRQPRVTQIESKRIRTWAEVARGPKRRGFRDPHKSPSRGEKYPARKIPREDAKDQRDSVP